MYVQKSDNVNRNAERNHASDERFIRRFKDPPECCVIGQRDEN
jgi:hypothetical protein